ncbi:MAG TPA: hypothetical protein ENH74_05230 [Methylophaga sp.]|nr:hypothetical protein [Methylophaga sp.]
MMTRRFASVAVMAALGLLGPMQANAFGLGKLELSSALNEPFKAEIPITALNADDVGNFQVRLASSKEFEQAGIERNFLLTQLKFDVIEKLGGVKIVISSQQPIREPFIDFLLTATTTGSGRLIREYTVLLDPPKSTFNSGSSTSAKRPTQIITANSSPTIASDSGYDSSISLSGNSYGPVSRTDTLWEIALNSKPDNNITVPQMMMALFYANPDAFQNGNVNGLKAGYTLSMPSESDIYKLTGQQALNAFKQQNIAWKNRNTPPAINPDSVEQTVTPPVADSVEETIEPAKKETTPSSDVVVSETNETATNNVDDSARLKLVVPTEEPSLNDDALSPLGSAKIKDLSEQLTLAQETIEGQTQENIDFKARMDALEVQMETMRRLISLKDADLARLQSMVEKDQQQTENTPSAQDATEVTDIDKQNEFTENEPVLNYELVDNQLHSANDDSIEDDELGSIFFTVKNIVTNNMSEFAIGSGALLLLLALLLLIKRRKEDNEWEEDDGQQRSDEGQLTENFNEHKEDSLENAVYASGAADVSDDNGEQSVAVLIEQADMLVGYGNFEKAMLPLEQAEQKEPANQLVLRKLLYVMYKQRLFEQFVSLAGRLDIDKSSAEWLEIAAWGRELAPSNTLFHIVTIASESEMYLDSDDIQTNQNDVLSVDEAEPRSDENMNEVEVENTHSNTIEFNLDDYASDNADVPSEQLDDINVNESFSIDDEAAKTNFDAPLNFDVDSASELEDTTLSLGDEPLSIELPDESYKPEDLSVEDVTLDELQYLDSDLDLQPESSDLEFDLSGYDEIDEAETKLDLASAYADMGDPDGARNILEEVLKEGNDEQKSKAQALLMSLS